MRHDIGIDCTHEPKLTYDVCELLSLALTREISDTYCGPYTSCGQVLVAAKVVSDAENNQTESIDLKNGGMHINGNNQQKRKATTISKDAAKAKQEINKMTKPKKIEK